MSFIILNQDGDLLKVGYTDENGKFVTEERWQTKEDAERALCLLTEYAIAGPIEKVEGAHIVETPDA